MKPSLPPLGLYIHLPWCERKCPYCDFNSHEVSTLPEQQYVDQLLLDLEMEISQLGSTHSREISTLFIGGGTPSLFSGAAITRLMSGICDRIAVAPNLEATMETNPGSAEAEKFGAFRAAGINRLSIGVQSFADEQLLALGRIHDSESAHAAIAAARSAGFDSFNVDLMHGLPHQGIAEAANDVEQAMASGAPHVSWYQLTLEPNTVFYKQPPVLPEENLLADIQDRGEYLLAAAGYKQYEVSAYARPGFECRHNRNYWEFGDYLGIGAGAHGKVSHDDGAILRYSKTRMPDNYLAESGVQRMGLRELSEQDATSEFLMNALRLNAGFPLSLFEQRTGISPKTIDVQLRDLAERGLLDMENDTVKTTPLGMRFLDTVLSEFLPE